MIIKSGSITVTIQRESYDPKAYTDSRVLYLLKVALNQRRGKSPRWIKKLMHKDGHLVADTQHYLRTVDRAACIYQTDYAVRDLWPQWNQCEPVTLGAYRWR